jgi:hypothetical protein
MTFGNFGATYQGSASLIAGFSIYLKRHSLTILLLQVILFPTTVAGKMFVRNAQLMNSGKDLTCRKRKLYCPLAI